MSMNQRKHKRGQIKSSNESAQLFSHPIRLTKVFSSQQYENQTDAESESDAMLQHFSNNDKK